jgi:two-component system, sensor histidine kinase and response regulator
MENKPKILLVDDRVENLIALETVLQDMNVELIKATSGNEALKQTLHHNFALALIDIQMPEMDGYELAGILREEEKTANLPFIFISGVFTDNLNVFKGYDKGAFSFITKPFQPEILLNKVKLFVNNYRNESLLKQLNEDLEEKNSELNFLNKELESFTYSVSHDLRAPLRAINGYSGILLEEHVEETSPEIKKLLNIINVNAKKMGDLIDNLLSFSKLGKQEIKKGDVDANFLIQSVIEDIKSSGEGKTVCWTINKLHSCYGDYGLLKQVFINLVSNAVKYSGKRDKPAIEIGSELTETECIYYIKDNGTGFDMKYADKLFGVFQRLHKPSEFEGTGVGLAIVQKIVNRHGGRVRAESQVNKGAKFYFAIPVVDKN